MLPHPSQTLFQEAVRAHTEKKFDTAKGCYTRFLASNPEHGPALNNLGALYLQTGDLEAAARCFRTAIELSPVNCDAWNNLGVILKETGRFGKAANCFEKALALNPADAEIHSNLGIACKAKGDLDQAEKCYRTALKIDPGHANAHNNLALILKEAGRMKEAVQFLRKAIALNPDDEEIYFNLGDCLIGNGDLSTAVQTAEAAVERFPQSTKAIVGAVRVMIETGNWEKADPLIAQLIDRPYPISDLPLLRHLMLYINAAALSRDQVAHIHSLCGALLEAYWDNQHAVNTFDHAVPATSNGKIRIGYLSPDFSAHSVGLFFHEIIKNHDSDRFDVHCYALSHRIDDITRSIRGHASVFRDVTDMEDREIAQLIFNDRIRILVDLAGYTRNNRLDVLAMGPAPVQVTAVGYPHGTGLSKMNYRITDQIAEGDEADTEYRESLIRLSGCFLPFPNFPKSAKIWERTDFGIPESAVVFGSFNAWHKLRPEVLKLWNRILLNTENTYLLFSFKYADTEYAQTRIQSYFDVRPERILFLAQTETASKHRARYHMIDLALDPFPYNGTTTSWEALYMGTPVITLKGNRHVQRTTYSLLNHLGMPKFAVETENDYLALATNFAKNPDQLHSLKDDVLRQVEKTARNGNQAYVQGLESQYIHMNQKYLEKIIA